MRADPANVSLALDAAAMARETEDLKAEGEILAAIASRHPDNAEIGHALGINALQQHDFRRAAVCFEGLLAAGHDHSALRYNLAFAQFYARAPQAAVDALAGFTDADWAELPQAHKLFAQAAHHVDEDGLERTISHLQKYLAVNGEDAEAHGLLALALFDDDLIEQAEQRILATLQRQPDEPNALLAQGGLALERQDSRLASESFEGTLKRQPANGRAWSGRGYAYLLDFDFPASRTAFEKAVEFMPDHIGTWNGLAWVQILLGDLAGAQQSLEKAMALDRNSADVHGSMAVIAAMQGRSDEGRLMARRARGLDAKSFSARYAESLLADRAGEGDRAQQIFQDMLSDSTVENGASVRELAAALMQRQQREADGRSKR
ncbi:hypothetical protein D0B54_04870 [Solimonas sp. K1W22B-7]|nr:hypothetical protein D0B54_04870 [Solimonas sp. K1W22B-7]